MTVPTRHRITAFVLFVALCSAIIATVFWQTRSIRCSKASSSAWVGDKHNDPVKSLDSARLDTDRMLGEPAESQTGTFSASSGSYVSPLPAESRYQDNCYGSPSTTMPDLTVPAYAIDEDGTVPKWVYDGPDAFPSLASFDRSNGNTPSNRFKWFAHMNRRQEVESLYDQLEISSRHLESGEHWVQVARDLAMEIRRQFMFYWVHMSRDHLNQIDHTAWDALHHDAPDRVQHRIRVFMAKFDYLTPFDILRRINQETHPDDYDFLPSYFEYLAALDQWQQKYGTIQDDVVHLSFQGCTRVFQHVDADAVHELAQAKVDALICFISQDNVISHCQDIIDFVKTVMHVGYDMFDRLPEPIRERLARLSTAVFGVIQKLLILSLEQKGLQRWPELAHDLNSNSVHLGRQLQELDDWIRGLAESGDKHPQWSDALQTQATVLWYLPLRCWTSLRLPSPEDMFVVSYTVAAANTKSLSIGRIKQLYDAHRHRFRRNHYHEPEPDQVYPQWILDAAADHPVP